MDCSDLDNYDKLTPENRLEVLSDFIHDWAVENDVEDPNVVSGEKPDDPATERDESASRAWYDSSTNTIGFDPDVLTSGDPSEALSSAGHELAHAQMRDWFGDDPDYATSEEWGEASEWYSDLFGDSVMDDMQDACEPDPPPESPAEPDVPDDDDGEPEEEEEGDDEPRRPDPWKLPPEEEPEPTP